MFNLLIINFIRKNPFLNYLYICFISASNSVHIYGYGHIGVSASLCISVKSIQSVLTLCRKTMAVYSEEINKSAGYISAIL